MYVSDLTQRAQLLQTELTTVRWRAQRIGSGATVHRVTNELSTADGALRLLHDRQVWAEHDHLEALLALAEESLRALRILIVQGQPRRLVDRSAA